MELSSLACKCTYQIIYGSPNTMGISVTRLSPQVRVSILGSGGDDLPIESVGFPAGT
jgi:hypothetical protein